MPLPKPSNGESRNEFVSRCMGDSIMRQEYPHQDQRSAVCYNLFDRPAHKALYAQCELGDGPASDKK